MTFNDGMKSLIDVYQKLNISCGDFASAFFNSADSDRIIKAEICATEASLEYRRRKRQQRLAADEAAEDGAYSCGKH